MTKKLALFFPLLAGVMWGSIGTFVRTLTAAGMNPQTVLFTRSVGASIFMFLFILIYDRKLIKIKIKDLWIFIGAGIAGMMGLNITYNIAINRLSLSLAAVLLCTSPVFVVIMSAFIFKEKMTPKKLVSMVLVIVGCILVSGALNPGNKIWLDTVGVISGIAAAICYALYSIFSKFAMGRGYHSYTIIFYSVFLAVIALLFFADYKVIGEYVSASPVKNILYMSAHSLISNVIPYIFYNLGLKYLEAGRVSIIASGGEPTAAMVFGMIVYMEIPSVLSVAGLIIVIAALFILCSADSIRKKEQQ